MNTAHAQLMSPFISPKQLIYIATSVIIMVDFISGGLLCAKMNTTSLKKLQAN